MEKQIVMSQDEYDELNSDSNRLEYVMSLFKLEDHDIIIDKTSILSMVLSKKLVEEGYKEVTSLYGSGKLVLLEGVNDDKKVKEVALSDYDIKTE